MGKERPILFNHLFVRAILEGRKTQTRRLIKPPYEIVGEKGYLMRRKGNERFVPYPLPYAVGDRLWVRETFRFVDFQCRGDDYSTAIEYRAGPNTRPTPRRHGGMEIFDLKTGWQPSIHMPRWASRLTLEVTDIRIQQLQDITEEDARAEGLPPNWMGDLDRWNGEEHGWLTPAGLYSKEEGGEDDYVWWKGEKRIGVVFSAREAFQLWWDHLYGKKAPWSSNPTIFALSFRVMP